MSQHSHESARVPFAQCVQSCFRDFLNARGNPSDVWVITTLRTGQQFVSLGLEAKLAPDDPSCVLIQGRDDTPKAIVVRDDDIAGVEFQIVDEVDEEVPTPFGFFPRPA